MAFDKVKVELSKEALEKLDCIITCLQNNNEKLDQIIAILEAEEPEETEETEE